MRETEFVLGIIPARIGSKGIKEKNISLLKSRPLIDYTFREVKRTQKLNDCILSTDSEKIAALGRAAGISVPFMRPSELALDHTSTHDVIEHALNEYEIQTGQNVSVVVILQPTTPLRTGEDIDRALALLQKNPDASSVISCYEATHVHPRIMYFKENDSYHSVWEDTAIIRRQEFEKVYVRNGAIYGVRTSYFKENRQLISASPLVYEMSRLRSVNIDEPQDLLIAEALLNKREELQ